MSSETERFIRWQLTCFALDLAASVAFIAAGLALMVGVMIGG